MNSRSLSIKQYQALLKLKKEGVKRLEVRFSGVGDSGCFEPVDIRPESVKQKVTSSCTEELKLAADLMLNASDLFSWMFSGSGCRGAVQLDLTSDPPQLSQWTKSPGYYRPKKWNPTHGKSVDLQLSELVKLAVNLEMDEEQNDG